MRLGITVAVFLIGFTASWDADACRTMHPDRSNLDSYSEILVGRVTGLHLDWYANRLLDKPDSVDPHLGGITLTNGAGPVRLDAVVTSAATPGERSARTFRLQGCTFNLPALKDAAIFFVGEDPDSATTVWGNDPAFSDWLDVLGVSPDDF